MRGISFFLTLSSGASGMCVLNPFGAHLITH